MTFERSSGILFHPTSLPGKNGIGTLGKEAYEFIDFLIETNQKLWQIFPLGPTGYGDSPYQCFSAHAGNPLLINLENLVELGLISNKDLKSKKHFDDLYIDYGKVINFKFPILKKVYQNYVNGSFENITKEFNSFLQGKEWLENYALFMSLKDFFGGKPWIKWDYDIRVSKPEKITEFTNKLADEMKYHKFIQFLFFRQWLALKKYANNNNIKIIGDIPIFVAFDSADSWANPEIFLFDEDRKPEKVAGVPPDYFSETGQLWGNPLYDWDKLRETNYHWWVDRIKSSLELYDIFRVDHFRGFSKYWAIPADEETAINGKWEDAYGYELFTTIKNELGELPIIAEDLGVITEEVENLRDYFNLLGMKVLQFAFMDEEESDYLPHTFDKNCIVYTGTHDNDTTLGWFSSAGDWEVQKVKDYFNTDGTNISWDFIRAAWASTANISIAPIQDILSLGSEARINVPGKASGNWKWRLQKNQISQQIKDHLKKITEIYYR